MDIVIVESPAKAKTINMYLGSEYKVLASFGHIRDLPAKDGSVLPDEDFAMKWDVDSASSKRLSEIVKALKEADGLILATDPDREGEAISWHVLEVLKQKKLLKDKTVKRVVFNAITKKSVLDAMANPRTIDTPLVDAYLARRALDYLVGFTLSPVLWRKLPGARSAGRVQSVALRIICDRESEIERFERQDYWSLTAQLATPDQESFTARLTNFEHKKLEKLSITSAIEAEKIHKMLEGATFKALNVEAKPSKRNPAPPFTTSTLQQAASSKLGFSASRTMQVAQRLYEGISIGGETTGLITYMRTDGVQIAPEAIDMARNAIAHAFGKNYVPDKPRFYATKAKNAQEAHEAIRPADFHRHPDQVRSYLDSDQAKLYDLIWKRAIASQMLSAEIERTVVEIEARNGTQVAGLRATGSVIRFNGFLAAYNDHHDTENEKSDDKRLPAMENGDTLRKEEIITTAHTTEPPPRYSEAALIKKLEELSIGRPSTYASTLTTLRERDYVTLDKRQLIPQAKGRVVTAFLENFFNRYVGYDFTAELEDKLDLISDGKLAFKDVLREFWKNFSAAVADIKDLRVSHVLDILNETLAPLLFPPREDNSDPRSCPTCKTGQLSLKLGRFGAFVGCSHYPDCNYSRQLGTESDQEKTTATELLGQDPETGEEINRLVGRFGPYIQRGVGKEAKRASIPRDWRDRQIDFATALKLLALPRTVGIHPETNMPIQAAFGRFGPYILHNGQYTTLPNSDAVFNTTLDEALALLTNKPEKSARRGIASSVLANLGEHPDGGAISIRDGRYGPYVNWGKLNATLPKERSAETITLAEALDLLAIKAAKAAPKRKVAVKKTASKKTTTAKKTKTKKTTEKKKES
ncbi:type I DNA topoisomerase [Bartonella sp. DGB2]|uniref:type I DNA topoisomerase n=1 Tax=Bartonella sp. DGB2 TaxID=3388426 RepID=UPI00398FD27C